MLTFPEFSLCRPSLVAFCISERRPQENKPEIVILVTQSCLTLCDPMDCSLPSSSPFPSPGDLPSPGIKPRSPTLQADSLLSELPGTNYLSSWCQLQLFWNTRRRIQDSHYVVLHHTAQTISPCLLPPKSWLSLSTEAKWKITKTEFGGTRKMAWILSWLREEHSRPVPATAGSQRGSYKWASQSGIWNKEQSENLAFFFMCCFKIVIAGIREPGNCI